MAFEDLKERQSVMWANGPYENVAATLTDVHELMMDRVDPQPGERVLDLACGTGAMAERAARAGAIVTAVDLSPGLIETARKRAADEGLDIDYRVGDCENLEGLEDASFDVAISTCGVMFAPDHEATARELARVVRPGGRIGLANWTPDGGLGRMFAMMAPFQAAAPPVSPFEWGRVERVRELLEGAFDLQIEEHVSSHSEDGGHSYWQLFSSSYGPVKTLAESLDESRQAELRETWVRFFEDEYGDGGRVLHHREYLLVTGTRR